jgi:hypothetical protein
MSTPTSQFPAQRCQHLQKCYNHQTALYEQCSKQSAQTDQCKKHQERALHCQNLYQLHCSTQPQSSIQTMTSTSQRMIPL